MRNPQGNIASPVHETYLNTIPRHRATHFCCVHVAITCIVLSEGEFPQDDHEKFRQAHEQRPSLNGDHLLCEAGCLADQLEDTDLNICNAFTLR